jgi:predicted dehydrogenase
MTTQKLKTAVVGCSIGLNHIQNYQKLPNAELVAICDIDRPWLKYVQDKYSVPQAYPSLDELLAKSDAEAVSVCLPVYLHKPATIAALQAGRHVLVEKPMAHTAAEAVAMTEAAQAAGKTLMVSYNQRFGADMQFLKKVVEAGQLGDIYFARAVWRRPLGMLPEPQVERATGMHSRNWFNEKDKGGGVGRDLGAHMIDLAMWIMGFPAIADVSGRMYNNFLPEWVSQFGPQYGHDADDHTVGFVRFENGASLQIEMSFGQHVGQEQVLSEFFGTKGGAVRDAMHGLKLFGEVAGSYTTTEPKLPKATGSTQENFVTSILTGTTPMVTPEQGIALMKVIDGLYSSGANFTKV